MVSTKLFSPLFPETEIELDFFLWGLTTLVEISFYSLLNKCSTIVKRLDPFNVNRYIFLKGQYHEFFTGVFGSKHFTWAFNEQANMF